MSPIVRTGYQNKEGKYFDKVREISFEKENLINNLGKFVAETNHEDNYFFKDDLITHGVYIYQSLTNPNIAYRIYKEFSDYGFNGYSDDKMIQFLQEKQEKIKLTQFPTGIVTLNGNIIGQEIPYYANYMTLFDYLKKYFIKDPFSIYMILIEIIKEMYEEEILYLDVHPKNFMINKSDLDIKMIDFDDSYVKFQTHEFYKEQLFSNIKNMIDCLNKLCGLDDLVFLQTDNFDDCSYQIKQMQKIIKL